MKVIRRFTDEEWLRIIKAREIRNERRSAKANEHINTFKPRTVLRKKKID